MVSFSTSNSSGSCESRVARGVKKEWVIIITRYLPMVSFSTSISSGSCESRVAREVKKELVTSLLTGTHGELLHLYLQRIV